MRIAEWLLSHNFPTVSPIEVDQPVEVDDRTVTFWRYYPQHHRPAPSAAHLGGLLRELHAIPEAPPVPLEPYQPLVSLGRELASTTSLDADDRNWLQRRRTDLVDAFQDFRSELGSGLIHGDAYPGNTLWDGDQVILGDWDEVAYGPRELDLTNTHQGARFGRSTIERDQFTAAYGWDVTNWPGYSLYCEIRDLHTLAAYLRRSEQDAVAAKELQYRVRTLRTADRAARWHRV